jgi:hypothetical protein
MLARDSELTVVTAQPGQERRERVGAVEAPDDLPQGMEQTTALTVHGGWEERPKGRVLGE